MTKRYFLQIFAWCMTVGCSPFKADKQLVDAAFFSAGDSSLNPPTDKMTKQCFGSNEFDACIFAKNPVAQEKGSVTPSQEDSKRLFGVKIRGLAPTGYLENAYVQVLALYSPRFTLQARATLKSAGTTTETAQFSAYYWSNRMFDYLSSRVGRERLPLRGLKIYPDDAFTGFSAANNSIHLAYKSDEWPKAFSGEIVIHLSAQALAQALSGNRLFAKDDSKHNFCALDPKGCCATDLGCAQALANGFGEYTAAMMFPESARVGESVANSNEGQKICSIARDLNTLSMRTRAQVFAACEPAGRAVLMGAWYASIWWKLRKQIEANESGAGADVDKIFFDHARAWTASIGFVEAKAAAMDLVRKYKGGKHTQAFSAGFTAAGI